MDADYLAILRLIISPATATITEIPYGRIPNWLAGSSVLIAICYCTPHGDFFKGFVLGMEDLATGIAVLLPFYLAGWMGAGGVKLTGAVDTIIGTKSALAAFLYCHGERYFCCDRVAPEFWFRQRILSNAT